MTSMPVAEDTALLNFFQEPLFVLTPSGEVLQANLAAKRLTGGDPAGRPLAEFVSSSGPQLRAWLRRCSGTTAPLVGSLTFRRPEGGTSRFRSYGARLSGSDDPVRIVLRCVTADTDAFSLLAKQVRDLNAENRQRRRNQAVLEEALVNNETLLRELRHRVKNNIQIMHGLFSAARREAESETVKRFAEGANQRLLAMGTAQQLMYQPQRLRVISAASFIRTLCEALGNALGPAVRLEVAADDGELSNEVAFPLALILNELLTNAFKHGLKNGRGAILVALEKSGRHLALTVHDSGPGFVAGGPERRSSGLGLVRGLCRQIGGRLVVENLDGARVKVEFNDRTEGS